MWAEPAVTRPPAHGRRDRVLAAIVLAAAPSRRSSAPTWAGGRPPWPRCALAVAVLVRRTHGLRPWPSPSGRSSSWTSPRCPRRRAGGALQRAGRAGARLLAVPVGAGRDVVLGLGIAAAGVHRQRRHRLHRVGGRARRGGRAAVRRRAGWGGPLPGGGARAAGRAGASSTSGSSWPGNCTTRSPTTSPPSRSRPRPAWSSPAPRRSAAATEALEVIDREAAATLAEMRAMVGALRSQRRPWHPRRRLADIEGLAAAAATRCGSTSQLRGDLADLTPAVEAALYRVAQESVTNARRHAQLATRVEVTVTGDAHGGAADRQRRRRAHQPIRRRPATGWSA